MALTETIVQFTRRGVRRDTAASRRLLFLSRCGNYRVEKVEITGYATAWRACAKAGHAEWRIVSRHRKRGPAERACRKHAKQEAATKRRASSFLGAAATAVKEGRDA